MTEWNGIKVGALYEQVGKGSDDAPLALVIRIKEEPQREGDTVELTTLEEGQLQTASLQNHPPRWIGGPHGSATRRWKTEWEVVVVAAYNRAELLNVNSHINGYKPWPYKAVA